MKISVQQIGAFLSEISEIGAFVNTTVRAYALTVAIGLFLKLIDLLDSAEAADLVAKVFGKTLSDAGQASDSPAKTVGKSTTDASETSDALALLFGKINSDAATLSDQQSLLVGKNSSDISEIADALAFVFAKVLSDAPAASESAELSITKPQSETISANDFAALAPGKSLADSAQTSDAQTVVFGKNPSDTPTASEAQAKFVAKQVVYTYAGADYFEGDYVIDDPTRAEDLAAKAISKPFSHLVSSSEIILLRPNLGKSDTVSSTDAGSLRSQGYTVDITYWAEDYVGEARTFT